MCLKELCVEKKEGGEPGQGREGRGGHHILCDSHLREDRENNHFAGIVFCYAKHYQVLHGVKSRLQQIQK